MKAAGVGLKTALLTNTGYIYGEKDPKAYHPDGKRKTLVPDVPQGLFDLIMESCKFGMRKPNTRLFRVSHLAKKCAHQPSASYRYQPNCWALKRMNASFWTTSKRTAKQRKASA